MKVYVAMSGGIDSSVAAAILKEQGHKVSGLTMQLLPHSAAIEDARQAAHQLGIPHHVIDFRDVFKRTVIEDFCREYRRGRTPNPCVRCNEFIKFGALQKKAAEIGADFIATGHYARIKRDGNEIYLKKGSDAKKDQSYFLCRLTYAQLTNTLFPIGHLTKAEVRQIAREKRLPTASRPESREICFIPYNDHAEFIKSYTVQSPRSGPIIDGQGNVLGEHHGIHTCTIGQRHGLGIAAAEPLYVTALAPKRNTVIVGTKAQTYGTELIAGDINWITPACTEHLVHVKSKVRYRHPEAEATLTFLEDGSIYVRFAEPQMAITPGQTIAFYDGDTVIGGGTILRQGR